MYTKIRARVKIGHLLFNWIKDSCGTNQGGPLSPSMFRKMLNDIFRDFLRIQQGIVLSEDEILVHILWADDLILLSDTIAGL